MVGLLGPVNNELERMWKEATWGTTLTFAWRDWRGPYDTCNSPTNSNATFTFIVRVCSLFLSVYKLGHLSRGTRGNVQCLLHHSVYIYTASWSCSQAVSKPVWHIPLLCVQWKTPDVGQRNCPKRVEFYSKNKFEKLVHLFGFITRTALLIPVTDTTPSMYRHVTLHETL